MAVTTTNLGVITAYGDAVAAGYTGTKAEWQALMASYATVGQQAVDAKNAAVAAKDTAVAKATEATTAASTATTKASEASASAQSIAQSAAQIQENTDDIDQLKSELNKYEEAEVISFTTGAYIANNGNVSSVVAVDSPTTSAGYAYLVANCKYNDRFIITGIGGGTPRLWAFIDKDNKLISKSDAAVTGDLLVVTAPFNARKIVVNTNTAYDIAYNCVKIPSDYAPNLMNNGEVEINFEPSYGIRTNGATVSFGIDSNGNVTVAKETAFWYANAIIPCNIYSKVKVTGTSSASAYRLWAFVDDEGNILKTSSGTETLTNFVFDIPKNAEYLILNIELDSPFSAVGFPKENTYYKFVKGYIATASVGSAITLTPVDSSTYECIAIPCVKGQKFTITGVTEDNSGKRLYAFADLYGYCRYRYNDGQQLIGSVVEAPVNGTLVINALADYAHSVSDSYPYALREPLTTLPPAFLGSMAFKPMGQLSKGYICLMTDDGYDDGTHGLVQETIPLAIAKSVPFTFALMRDSDVCKDNTKLAAVIDAVENHGCSVAQHGEFVWQDKSEDYMNTFFDLEKAFFDAKGIELHGAVIPAHYTTELIKAICGGRFGVVRSGYSGIIPNTQDPAGTVTNFYDYYTSGEQSNLYCLSSYNNASATDAYNTAAVDYAFANNKILICYFHENAMDATMWQRVSDMIDYAKTKGLEFITLGDIPYLINA